MLSRSLLGVRGMGPIRPELNFNFLGAENNFWKGPKENAMHD